MSEGLDETGSSREARSARETGSASKTGAAQAPQADYISDAVVLEIAVDPEQPGAGLADLSTETGQALAEAFERARLANVRVEHVDSLAAAERVLETKPVAVLVLAGEASGAVELARALAERHPFQRPVFVLVGVEAVELLQPLVQADLLFYTSPTALEPTALAEIVAAAVAHYRHQNLVELAAAPRIRDPRAVALRSILGLYESLLATADLEGAAEPIFEALEELVGIDDLRLFLYEPTTHALRDPTEREDELSAASGATSWAARVGRTLALADQKDDPRHDPDVDGDGRHLLAVPVIAAEGRVLGVLAASRTEGEPFDEVDARLAERLAAHVVGVFESASPLPLDRARASLAGNDDLFRREAIDAHASGFSERGQVLRYEPGWSRWTWILLLAGFVTAMLFATFGRMHDYAAGPAVVRIGQRVEVTSPTEGAVTRIEVRAAERVAAGQPLVRLYGASEAAQITNLEEEFEQRLRQRLSAPGDSAIEASLIDVRTRLEQARDRLDQRIVRAPIAGVVGDVRIRPGQHASAGELLLSVLADADQRTVLGLVPAQFGPQLEAGQPVRLTLDGYPDLAFRLRLRSVGAEAAGAADMRQAVGRSMADSLPAAGPLVLVDALLPEGSFRDGGRTFTFTDGMRGALEIRVRSRPVIVHLIPGLDAAFRRWRSASFVETAGENGAADTPPDDPPEPVAAPGASP